MNARMAMVMDRVTLDAISRDMKESTSALQTKLEIRCRKHLEAGSRADYIIADGVVEVRCMECKSLNAVIAIAEHSGMRGVA